MKRIYMDNAAATPTGAKSLRAMIESVKKFPGNPGGIHKEGKDARACLEQARLQIAGVLSARPDEIVFTSGATEANNMAVMGVVLSARTNGIANPHIIVSAIEHPSVLESAHFLKNDGIRVDYLPVDNCGLIDTKELRKLITPETVLVSIMYANNEIGTIEPIIDIAKEIRHARKTNASVYPYFHTDAAQAGNYLNINVLKLGVDLMTLSSGKTYGPRGIGALFVKRGVQMSPLMYGGGHEGGRRPGTEVVALAVGFSVALEEAQGVSEKESRRVQKLRDSLATKILKKVSGNRVNGLPATAYRSKEAVRRLQAVNLEHSLPNILNISFDGVESEALVLYLDAAGIAVSGKSACMSAETGASHVIIALGESVDMQAGSIRFSIGRDTRSEDIVCVVKELERIVPLLREARVQSDTV